MAKQISVSRAARLVGVKRGTLQQKIRSGELKTFEGAIVLSDLLQAYPNAQIEDSSMLERVEQIMEQAAFVNLDSRQHHPDNSALSSRILSLSRELHFAKQRVQKYQQFFVDIRQRALDLKSPDERQLLLQWLDEVRIELENTTEVSDPLFANEAFLRTMTAQATLLSSGHEFFIEGIESILEAGLRGGFALNYGCSNGNCGLCKIRVVSGECEKIRHHDYSLSEAEKGLGYVLSCSYTAVSDVVLDADEATGISDIPRQDIPIRIKKIERPNEQMLIVSAKTPRTRRLRFLAGQRARLSIDHVGSSLYPIASCPCDDMNLQFHVPLQSDDAVAQYLSTSAKVNDLINLEGPSGSFVLNENSSNSLIFIAKNSGFATVKGLIEHAMALDVAEQILLFWVGDSEQDLYSRNLCRAWNDALDNFEFIPLPDGQAGLLLDAVKQQQKTKDASAFDYYLCADADFESAFHPFIDANQVPSSQYHFDEV